MTTSWEQLQACTLDFARQRLSVSVVGCVAVDLGRDVARGDLNPCLVEHTPVLCLDTRCDVRTQVFGEPVCAQVHRIIPRVVRSPRRRRR